MDEEIIKSNLRFWNGASCAVKLRHHHRQTFPFLILGLKMERLTAISSYFIVFIRLRGEYEAYLGKVLLRNPLRPLAAESQGSGGITHISTLDQHPFDHHRVHPSLTARHARTLSAKYKYNLEPCHQTPD